MRLLLITLAAVIIAGCGRDDLPLIGSDCDTEQVAANLEEVAERWDDAVDIASSTGRIAMSGPVSELQSIRRDTRDQDWPECAADAHAALIESMDETIKAFIAFMSDDPESEINAHLEKAGDYRSDFRRELSELRD